MRAGIGGCLRRSGSTGSSSIGPSGAGRARASSSRRIVSIEVSSRDPISGGEVRVQIAPGEQATWQPAEAVVLAGSTCCDGPSFGGCCDVLNFFETLENAQRYLHEHPDITGTPISIPEAAEAGRIVFGEVLQGD